MTIKVAINGFGRMGRLALRAAWEWPELEIVHINECSGSAADAAHLLKYDSQHGVWLHKVEATTDQLFINDISVSFSANRTLVDTDWAATKADVIVECTGKFKTEAALAPYFTQGIRKVVVSAPIKKGPLNIVMGVNDHLYDPSVHHIITAASCTTNCLAPVVDVIHRKFGIRHGSITTIHDVTNTQSVLDNYHKDLRRARASSTSLIPTTTGSATAIAEIFPELAGRLNGIAVRVPITNASLTDCVFELEEATTVAQVNAAFQQAAEGRLKGILGFEELPLVSVDYLNDTRSSVVDAASTMIVNGTQLKVLAWYDNEIGYVNRLMELALKVGKSLR